ncbi:hypothetical protein A2U01_0021080, partial [Trifolium medium]|nr:hypothetical protein [Trifolium medium]
MSVNVSDSDSESPSSPKSETPQPTQPDRSYHENHPVQITTNRMNGGNYFRWSRSVRMYLRGRGKIGYITRDKKQPDKKGADFNTWDAENSMVMTWLVNSMTEEISANYLCYATAKDLWDNVSQMYSDLENQSQKSPEDCKHYTKTVDVSRVFKFLAGLNVEFDEVHGRILGRNPIPQIGEVFAEVRREESRTQVIGTAREINGLYYFDENLL